MFIEENLYKQIIERFIIPAVDLIFINKKNKILLWLRNNEPLKWEYYIPWWRRYKNEPILESAKRKAREELGISIDTNKLIFLNVYDDICPWTEVCETWLHFTTITYVYYIDIDSEEEIKISDKQHESIKFFDISDPSLNQLIKIRINDIINKNLLHKLDKNAD